MDWLFQTKRTRLSNGLTILTNLLPNSEVAALHFCVKAGYFCETDEEVGLAHLLEHMYFKGSRNFPLPESLGVGMKALGGMINATTSYDQTCYFCELPSESLFSAIDLMSDAFVAPNFPADELERETEVVIEEFNRKIDSPSAYSIELLIQLAYTTHRMKRWRIGTPEQLRTYRRNHLFDYFHRYYQPQNMIITVTGKFDEAAVLQHLERAFSEMKNGELRKDFGPAEPAQKGLRLKTHRATATQSYLHMGWHVPGVTHEDQQPLEFLSSLLSSGKSARLHRYLVERRRSASGVSCGVMAYEDEGMIHVSAVTEAGKIREASRDVWTVIQDTLRNGISDGEMQKVKNRLKLNQLMQTEDALNLAELLSYYESYGDYLNIQDHLQKMDSLTETRILEVAKKYLTEENLSVLEFINEDLPQQSDEQFLNSIRNSFVAPEVSLPPPLVLTESVIPQAKASPPQPVIHRGKVTYLLQPDPLVPFIAGGIFFRGGRNEETDSTAGLTHFLMRLALKGTSRFDGEQISFRFDALGNPPRFSSNRDLSGFLFETLPESFSEMWNLLLHCLSDARFPEKEIETERGKVISAIRRSMDDNFARPLQLFQRAFYGSHPYGLPETGFEETVNTFGEKQLSEWKARLFQQDRILVSLIGNFDAESLLEQLKATEHLLPASGIAFVPPSSERTRRAEESVEIKPKKQTAFVLGFPSTAATSPDEFKYEILQQVLSGMGGRLFQNLRSKKSLAYTVYAGNAASLYAGAFLTYIAGDASKEARALEGMWLELAELQSEPVRPEELLNAKRALTGSYALHTQSAASRAIDLVNNYILGHPVPFAPYYRKALEAITADDILDIAKRTFHKESSAIGITRGTTELTDAEKLVTA